MAETKMLDALNHVDDEIIERALNIDSAEKFKEITMKEQTKSKNKIIKMMSAFAACICLVAVAVSAVIGTSSSKHDLVQITDPITEVSSLDEMKDYLGFDVPELKGKKADSYIVIGDDGDKYAYHARVNYTDGTSLEMEKKKDADVSGFYGGTKLETVTISGVSAEIYSLDDTFYANLSVGDYSYSISSGSRDGLKSDLTTLVNAVNQ